MNWENLVAPVKEPEITFLPIIPPNNIIPALQRFKDAPYKFQKGYSFGDGIKYLVWFDEESIITYNTFSGDVDLFVFTRTSKRIYAMPLPLKMLPTHLSSWVGFDERLQTMSDFTLIKEHFGLKVYIKDYKKDIVQGDLVLHAINVSRIRKVNLWSIEQTDVIYNHKFENATVYKLPYNLWLIVTFKNPKIISSDHETVELEPYEWYIAYHPLPEED